MKMKKVTTIGFSVIMMLTAIGCKNNSTTHAETSETKTDKTKPSQSTTNYSKNLELQGFRFDVKTTGEGPIQLLTIQPYGLKIDSTKINLEIDGFVTNVEIADLNADGYPELLIYKVSSDSSKYGNVIGYSVNEGKSISAIYFPSIAENPKANKGYMGHDEFAIGELALLHRFKIYNAGDNNRPTGKTRQIQYKLKDGEASRQFVVDKILDY